MKRTITENGDEYDVIDPVEFDSGDDLDAFDDES